MTTENVSNNAEEERFTPTILLQVFVSQLSLKCEACR